MRQPDLIDKLLAEADPLDGDARCDPDSAFALDIRDRAAGRPRPRTWRRVVVATVVAAAMGAAGVTMAYSSGDGRAVTSDGVVCNGSETSDLQARFDPRTEDPVKVCRREWQGAFAAQPPAELTACVDAGIQGAIEVYPGPAAVCADHGSVPYTGPTDEQLRFAAFREDALALRETVQPGECIDLEQIKAALDPLLAEHGLEGWTYGFPKGNAAPCAQVEGFVERTKTIVVSHHPRRS